MLWADAGREPLRHYDKRHLFRMANEHDHFTPGGAALSVEWRGFRICPLVCYDLRFPVFSRRRAGARVRRADLRRELAGARGSRPGVRC